MSSLRDRSLELLRRGLCNRSAEFRTGQWEAVELLLKDRARLLVVERTGWGKSLVYFVATKLLRDHGKGPTLLISPLLSLMRNQIEAAERIGVRAETINSTNPDDWHGVEARLRSDDVDILLISPERLANEEFRQNVLLGIVPRAGLLVVDEAHCIADWGHDFRPDYRRISRVIQALPATVAVLTTTATANDRVIDDIQAQLGSALRIQRGPLARASLRLQNVYLPNQAQRLAWLAEHLPAIPGSGIIYVLTKRDADRVAGWLRSQKLDAHAYYSDSPDRPLLEQKLLANEVKALVATTALGMGFDKPDLRFVIHFQRPGSVIHYYQQVGRAGRAVKSAFGILLSGDEDQDIIKYFIETAFPADAHVEVVLGALEQAQDGLTVPSLQRQVNLGQGQIEKVLKLLSMESPAPVTKIGSHWHRTPVRYAPDRVKIEQLTQLRRREQEQMQDYMQTRQCLMAFLSQALDDPHAAPCGRCANCVGKPLFPPEAREELVRQAVRFLGRSELTTEPRKRWPGDVFAADGWSGNIARGLQVEMGRALCMWGDAGWGEAVRRGKFRDGYFGEELVDAAADMLRERWRPVPAPAWVTCVPSRIRPTLVRDFAGRLAARLGLSFVECIHKTRDTAPQKTMANSFQQAKNLAGAFKVNHGTVIKRPVLLIDDMIHSGWTMTIVGALLKQAGSGPVYPLALSLVSFTQG